MGRNGADEPGRLDEFEIDAGAFAETESGRELLGYLARCALAEDQLGILHADDRVHRFRGSLGLAPAWRDRGLTASEQRWVSACIAAHINHFGVSVPISVRGRHPALRTPEPGEAERFTLYEGGFFGNIFVSDPALFACAATESPQRFPVEALRVCTRRQPGVAGMSVCGFAHAGRCPEPGAPVVVAGRTVDEVVAVFLDPTFDPEPRAARIP